MAAGYSYVPGSPLLIKTPLVCLALHFCLLELQVHTTMPVLCHTGDGTLNFMPNTRPGSPLSCQGTVSQESCLGSHRSLGLSVPDWKLWGVAKSVTFWHIPELSVKNSVVIWGLWMVRVDWVW